MSVWSSVEGVVIFSVPNHRCSLKTLIKELYDEVHVKITQHGERHYDIWFNFSLENEAAFGVVKTFAERVKEYDKGVIIDLDVKIRYIV